LGRRYGWLARSFFFQFVHDVENVPRCSVQAVQLDHDEDIAGRMKSRIDEA
jgi:hypothetical protein